MNHVKRIDEFNSYTDDAAKNVPQELLDNDTDVNANIHKEMSNLKPNIGKIVEYIIGKSITSKTDVDEIISDLDLSENEIMEVEDALINLTDVLLNYSKNKARQN